MNAKAELRHSVRDRLAGLDHARRAAASRAVADRLAGLPEVAEAGVIFTYISDAGEVDTRGLIRCWLDEGRAVAVPRTGPDGFMAAHRIVALDGLAPGRFGIPEPQEDAPIEPEPDLCIVPAVAVTAAGDRLGRAGGYYDRYLEQHPGAVAVALVFDEQFVEHIPSEPHDRPMDLIVTPTRVIRCRDHRRR